MAKYQVTFDTEAKKITAAKDGSPLEDFSGLYLSLHKYNYGTEEKPDRVSEGSFEIVTKDEDDMYVRKSASIYEYADRKEDKVKASMKRYTSDKPIELEGRKRK